MNEEKSHFVTEVTEIDPLILHDLESKYADVRCPLHGVPPKFEVDEKGGVIEAFCCDVLLQIFRELSAQEDLNDTNDDR